MCILLYVKVIWSSGIPQIYDQLEEGALVYVHSAICETYEVQWYSILLWLIRGYICPEYMCILLYVKVMWCSRFQTSMVNWRRGPLYMCILLYLKLIWWSGIPYIYGQLEEGGLGLCAFCHMLKLGGVVVSIHLWSIGGGGHWYVCILVYVKLILCRGILYIYGQLEEGGLGIFAFCYM